jgi:hypothetical protein
MRPHVGFFLKLFFRLFRLFFVEDHGLFTTVADSVFGRVVQVSAIWTLDIHVALSEIKEA